MSPIYEKVPTFQIPIILPGIIINLCFIQSLPSETFLTYRANEHYCYINFSTHTPLIIQAKLIAHSMQLVIKDNRNKIKNSLKYFIIALIVYVASMAILLLCAFAVQKVYAHPSLQKLYNNQALQIVSAYFFVAIIHYLLEFTICWHISSSNCRKAIYFGILLSTIISILIAPYFIVYYLGKIACWDIAIAIIACVMFTMYFQLFFRSINQKCKLEVSSEI